MKNVLKLSFPRILLAQLSKHLTADKVTYLLSKHTLMTDHFLLNKQKPWRRVLEKLTERSTGREIPNFVKKEVYYRVNKSPPQTFILSQLNQIHTLKH
jgi:hypothetical protein